jgi:hypothetical protein
MHEERGRAGRCERGCDLVADVARLAHAGHDHAAARGQHEARGRDEGRSEAGLQRAHRIGLDVEHAAREREEVFPVW